MLLLDFAAARETQKSVKKKKTTATGSITILTESTSRSITRQLQSPCSDCKVIDLDGNQTGSWTGHRMDKHTGLGKTFNSSYHMINSDGKSQSYNTKYAISAIMFSYVYQSS